MHDKVGVGQSPVDLEEAVHLECFPGGLTGELVSAMAGADGDSERVHASLPNELDRLVGIGEVAEAIEASAVAVFNAAQAADFAFHGDALGVRRLHDFARRLHIVFER